MQQQEVTVRDVRLAKERIAPLVTRTPLLRSRPLSEQVGAPAYLKLENLQDTASFKIRGAANRVLTLAPEDKERGVVTVSTGNHGRAMSYVAKRLDVHAVVCIPEGTARNKVEAMERLGAEIVITGKTYDEAEAGAHEVARERGLSFISAYDEAFIIAGQGTVGLEILEDLPDVGAVLVPVSGGGLMSGVALAVKAAGADKRVIGVSMDRAPVMYHSLKAGKPIRMEEEETLADALVGGLDEPNKYTFRLIQELVDDFVLVSRLGVEGGGAVGIAALRSGKVREIQGSVAVVVSGGNVDLPLLFGLAQDS